MTPKTYNLFSKMKPRTKREIWFRFACFAAFSFVVPLVAGHSAMAQSLPYPAEWAAPAGFPLAPGEFDATGLVASSAGVNPKAPLISEWHRTVFADESFVLSGSGFSSADGRAPKVWIQAGGKAREVECHPIDDSRLMATVPAGLAHDLFFVWVENDAGISAPVALNRARPEWLGPLGSTAKPGQTKRVFGRNLSREHGDKVSHVYLKSGKTFHEAKVTSVEPYAVEFVVPEGLADGDYEVFVHNTHGGIFGFGGVGEESGHARKPVLSVRTESWKRGDTMITLRPSGEDDTLALQEAIDSLTAEPDGGTLQLEAGTFVMTRQLNIREKVAFIGKGRDATTLEIRFTRRDHSGVVMHGSHIRLADLTIRLCKSDAMPQYSMLSSWWQTGGTDDLKVVNVRWNSDPGVPSGGVGFSGNRIEVTGVEAFRGLGINGSENWVYGNQFFGAPYGGAGSESAMYMGGPNSIVERNRFETRDWPTGPAGSRNYRDFVPSEELKPRVWSKRMLLSMGVPASNCYIAHNITKDVATQDNKGEMILFHERSGFWFGRVAGVDGVKLTLSTETAIEGKDRTIHHGTQPRYKSGGALPEFKIGDERTPNDVFYEPEPYVVIVRGRGFGQARKVVAQDGQMLTLDSPWRVEPDAESVVVLEPMYLENIIYRNELNAFPEGYRQQTHSATNGIQYDGNAWRNVAEGNVSRRTSSGRRIGGRNIVPSYWNEFRGEVAEDVMFSNGFMIMTSGDVFSPASFANAFRGGSVQIRHPMRSVFNTYSWLTTTKTPGGTPETPTFHNLANIFENVQAEGRTVWLEEGQASAPKMPEGTILNRNLVRGNKVTLTGSFGDKIPVTWKDFSVSFKIRPLLPDKLPASATPSGLWTISLNDLKTSLRLNQSIDAGQATFFLGDEQSLRPPMDAWTDVSIIRKGAAVTLRVGDATQELTLPNDVDTDAVSRGLRLQIHAPFHVRDFEVRDASGALLFADAFRDYPGGSSKGDPFTLRGWQASGWGTGEAYNMETGERDFVLRGRDLSITTAQPWVQLKPIELSPLSDPVLINNTVEDKD